MSPRWNGKILFPFAPHSAAAAPGNVQLSARATGLPRDSVANVSQLVALDRSILIERVGRLSSSKLELVLAGIDTVLGR